jgi:16S rRNA (cytidine1402-2'-O)-methyltransferase
MSETIEPGALYVVSTPIGNLDDITLRAIRILGGVDVIAAEDTRKTRFLLDHLSIAKPLMSFYTYNEGRRVPELVELLKTGKSIAVVTDAGTPGVSDPAYSIIHAAVAHNIKVIPIPGASATLAALVASGLPMDSFAFEGFLPVKKGRKTKLGHLSKEERTMVFYESPFRVEKTLQDMLQHFGDRQVAVARELTKKFEEVLRGTITGVLNRIKGKSLKGEFVLVVAGASYVYRGNASTAGPSRSGPTHTPG